MTPGHKRTAVLIIKDIAPPCRWIGPLETLKSSYSDYRKAYFQLQTTVRLFRVVNIEFKPSLRFSSYTHGVLYEDIWVFQPENLEKLAQNYARLEDALQADFSWRCLPDEAVATVSISGRRQ
jgi:hypothetical protein